MSEKLPLSYFTNVTKPYTVTDLDLDKMIWHTYQLEGQLEQALRGATGHAHTGSDGQSQQIDTAGLKNNAVTSAKIDDLAVTSGKIASNAVTAAKIGAGQVGSSELATNAVTQVKVADGAIGNAELASLAVTTAKVSSVDESKINFSSSGHEHGGGSDGNVIPHSKIGSVGTDDHHDKYHEHTRYGGSANIRISEGFFWFWHGTNDAWDPIGSYISELHFRYDLITRAFMGFNMLSRVSDYTSIKFVIKFSHVATWSNWMKFKFVLRDKYGNETTYASTPSVVVTSAWQVKTLTFNLPSSFQNRNPADMCGQFLVEFEPQSGFVTGYRAIIMTGWIEGQIEGLQATY